MELPPHERWTTINEILVEAQERPPEERDRFLERACGGDDDLREQVRALLEADASHGHLFDRGAAALAGPLIDEHSDPSGLDEASLEPGRRVGPYRLQAEVGRGGTSTVYRAVRADEQFERTVAVKVLRRVVDPEAETAARFRAERQILASLSHPHLAEVYDGGVTEEGRPYLVMEYVDGRPITEHCRAEACSRAERLALFRQAAAAVQAAHEQLVVHRDLKPVNVLVERGSGQVKLLDFGIAKILGDLPGTAARTQTGRHPMTPAYAAPEQVKGDPISVATDTYALGVLLYELLTGTRPYGTEEQSPYAVARAVCEEEPTPPSAIVEPGEGGLPAAIGPDLDAIVMMALRKAPDERYGTVDALLDDLDRYQADRPVTAQRGGWGYRARKFVRRHRRGLVGALATVLLLAGFAVYHVWTLSAERDRAQREAQKAERVSAFLVDLMERGNPYGGEQGGDAVTVREVMDQGAERLRELRTQPEVQAEMQEVIGRVYRELGHYEEAYPLLRRSLEQRRRQAGDESAAVGSSLHQLGLYYQQKGEYETADSTLRAALTVRRTALPPGHPAVAETMAELGNLQWYNFGNYAVADSLLHKALRLRRVAYDTSHVDLAASLNDLANLYHRRGQHEEAARYYREALSMYKKLLGSHPNVAIVEGNFATLLRDMGRYDAAETRQRASLRMHRKHLGPDNIDVALGQGNLARIYLRRGEPSEARPLFEEALETLRSIHEGPHPYLVRMLSYYGQAHLQHDSLNAAEQAFRKAQSQAQAVLPPKHPVRAGPLLGLGRVHLASGRPGRAEPLLRKGLSLQRDALGNDHWRVGRAQSLLGACLAEQDRFKEAESLLLNGFNTLRTERPSGDPPVQSARQALIELYTAWGKPGRAETYRAQTAPSPTDP